MRLGPPRRARKMWGVKALYDDAPHIVHVHNSSSLRTPESRFFAVEFFAAWCGHCQAFSPTWKEVGRLSCAAAPTMHIGVVDCVAQASICQEFQVQSFPTIRLFTAQHDSGRSNGLGQPLRQCQHGCKTAAAVLKDILQVARSTLLPQAADALIEQSARAGCAGTSTANGHGSRAQLSGGGSGGASSALKPGEAPPELSLRPRPMEDVTSAVLYGLRHELLSRPNVPGSRRHTALTAWLSLLSEALPGDRNRQAIRRIVQIALPRSEDAGQWAAALHSLPTPWLPDGAAADGEFLTWRACRGFSPSARGFPCGLWSLFHTLLAHTPDQPAEALLAIEGYVEHFFGCAACVAHFLTMARGASSLPPAPDGRHGPAASSVGEAALWLWRAHNAVNLRLNSTGRAEVFKLGLAKVQWPDARTCPGCRGRAAQVPARLTSGAGAALSPDWDEKAVLQFLTKQYCHSELSPCAPSLTSTHAAGSSSSILDTLTSASAAARNRLETAVDRAAAQSVAVPPRTLSAVVGALVVTVACAWIACVACGCRRVFPLRHHHRTALRRYRAVNAVGRAVGRAAAWKQHGPAYEGVPMLGASDASAASSEDEYR